MICIAAESCIVSNECEDCAAVLEQVIQILQSPAEYPKQIFAENAGVLKANAAF